jgi:hypothetical protein
MPFQSVFFLTIAFCCALSHSQHHDKPVPNNQWKISNLALVRYLNPNSFNKLGALFEIDRIYYEACNGDPGATAAPEQACGVKATKYPVLCSSWGGYDAITDVIPTEQEFYTCHGYRIGAEDERLLPANAKQWLEWRLFGLQEISPTPAVEGQSNPSLQSVKLQILNGVPVVQ